MTEYGRHRKGVPAPWTADKALERLAGLCARSEQCEWDLRCKMKQHGVLAGDADTVIDYLVEHKFLDEERFARSYARDKIRFNHWGRVKVTMMLRTKRVPGYAITAALEQIDYNEYLQIAGKLVRAATRSLDMTVYEDRMKLLRRMYSRGFEPEVVKIAIENVMADDDSETP